MSDEQTAETAGAEGASERTEEPSAEHRERPTPPDLVSLIEKAFLMGLGAAAVTRDKVNELADDLVERGRISQTDAKKMSDWITDRASEQQHAVTETVSRETERAMKTVGVATSKDIEDLRAQILELKTMIAEGRGGGPVASDDYVP